MADTLQDCAATQRVQYMLEKWADRSLTGFNTGKCQMLHLGRNNSMNQCIPWADLLVRSFAGKNPGVLVDSKLNVRQQCALVH